MTKKENINIKKQSIKTYKQGNRLRKTRYFSEYSTVYIYV